MMSILDPLGHENLWIRTAYAYLVFVVLLGATYAVSFLALPEGIMGQIPFPVFQFFQEGESLLTVFSKTVGFNLFMVLLVIAANHFRVRSFTFGFLPLYTNTVILGLFAGTDSFSGPISTYTPEGWLMFLRIGFLEFSSYILAGSATISLAMFHAERWRGEHFRRVRRFKDIRLAGSEIAFLIIGFVLLVVAAFNEWRHIG